MKQRRRIYYSAAQRSEIWDRWQAGEPMSAIGRRFDRESSSVFSVISPTGGIRPPDRHRAKQALGSLSERESSLDAQYVAARCGRSRATWDDLLSTISREVQRNGGADRYRGCRVWIRPPGIGRGVQSFAKLACRPFLRRTVSTLLRRQWSPEQIAGWLKRTYPVEPLKQVSHETIYRSLFIQARGAVLEKELRAPEGEAHGPPIQAREHEAERARPDQERRNPSVNDRRRSKIVRSLGIGKAI